MCNNRRKIDILDGIEVKSYQSASWLELPAQEEKDQINNNHTSLAKRAPTLSKNGFDATSQNSFKLVDSYEKEGSDSESDCPKIWKGGKSSGINPHVIATQSFIDLFNQSKAYSGDSFLVLAKIMMVIFEGKDVSVSALELMTNSELSILSSFVFKKCRVSFEISEKKSKIADLINKHKTAYKHKRNEENYKLIFKKAIKYLTKKLKIGKPELEKDKTTLLVGFYDTYFRKEFEKAGLDKTLELDSKDIKKLVANFSSKIYNPKTVNPKYIGIVAHSRSFIDEVVTYLNDVFFKEYSRNRYYKLDRILSTCKDPIGNNQDRIEHLKNNIQSNPRFKLPWYDDELKKAMKCVQGYLETKCNVQSSKFSF